MATKQTAILERSIALTILVSWGVLPVSPMISGRDDDNDDDQLVAIDAALLACAANVLLGNSNIHARVRNSSQEFLVT
tara:strand:- start:79 stop:312 length:234 start_codon:yes stop_codon:yes gene_type:complete